MRQDGESCARDEQKRILSFYPVKRIIHRLVKATESAVVFSRDSVFIDLFINVLIHLTTPKHGDGGARRR